MLSIFLKEINSFYSSLVAYITMGVFLVMIGLFMWVFADTSVLVYNYASLDTLFTLAPLVFLFLIPAVTMRSLAEEKSRGTIEFLATKPLRTWDIIVGKFLANWVLVLMTLLPTLLYYYSVYHLGSPKGNLDSGGIAGSYIGLAMLSAVFVAIGIWASAISNNQIVAFVLGAFLCFFVHYGFGYLARLPFFSVTMGSAIEACGIEHHYANISRGVVDSRDVIYFVSVTAIFLILTRMSLSNK